MSTRDEIIRAKEMAEDLAIHLARVRDQMDGFHSDDDPLEEMLKGCVGFGERLKRLRSYRDMTQAALAEKSGMSVNAIVKLEKGDTIPRMSTIFKLCQALEVPGTLLEGSWD